MNAPGALNSADTRVMLALLRVHEREGRATVNTVAWEADRGIATTHKHLHRLGAAGLIAVGVRGGLHPLVGVVR